MKRVVKGAVLALVAGVVVSLASAVTAWAAVTCGSTITTNTVLTTDLNCPGNGVFIRAPNVTFDLGGHTISGTQPTEPGFTGVTIRSVASGSIVRNGTIRGFSRGVAVNPGANNVLITGLTLDANGLGVALFSDTNTGTVPTGARILNNKITNTTRISGIQMGGNNHVVEGNEITNGANAGILLFGNDNVIQGNTITESGASGIFISPTPGGGGPFLRNQIVRNTVTGSGRIFNSSAISIRSADSTVVRGNTVVGRGSTPGVFVENSSNTLISANILRGNGSGVLVRNSTGTSIVQNTVNQNRTGIWVEGSATGTLVAYNTVFENQFDGIHVEAASTTITANTAYRNGNLGIFAVSGVTDGGGNRAFANGNPAQCSPTIVCS